jgi:hypothetical protein
MFFSKLFTDSYGVEHLPKMNYHTMHSPIKKIFLCFMVNGLSQYNTSITFKLHNFVQMTFYHQCGQFCNTFIYLNQYVWHDILNMEFYFIFKCPFVSWFRILLQYDVSIVFLLHFGMVMQYPSRFQNICYRTQRISKIPYKGYCMCIKYS